MSMDIAYCIFFVNNDVIKDVGELRQRIVEEWVNGNNSASMWLTMRSDSGAGDCETVSMQMVDSLNILCDWQSDYHNGRHCRFLSVWLYCIDCTATCSALYSLALIRLFIAKNIYYIFHKVQWQQNLHSLANICCKLYANWPIIVWIIAKNKRGCFLWNTLYKFIQLHD